MKTRMRLASKINRIVRYHELVSWSFRLAAKRPPFAASRILKFTMLKQILKIRELVIFICALATALVFYIIQPGASNRFLTPDNLKAILTGLAPDGLIAIGMTLVIITGGFDLSVGSTLALGGYVASVALLNGYDTTVAVALGVLSGAAVGLVNGLIITKIKVNPLVTTLGTMTIVRGIVLVETQGRVMTGFPQSFRQLGEGSAFGVFYPVIIFLVLAALADLLLRHSRFLRQTYYVGGNEEAARLSGIDVDRVRIVMYVITGMLAAMAGVITTAKNGSASPMASGRCITTCCRVARLPAKSRA